MKLTALQLPARFDAIGQQLAYAEALLESGPRTDLVLFPEASLTGYMSAEGHFDLSRFAEPANGHTRDGLAQLAKRFNCLVVGPLIERAKEGLFNAVLGITPEGTTLFHYRKYHPWFPETWATPGAGPAEVVSWRGKKLLPAICFDVHFLEADAAASLDAADVLLFASAWVDEEGDARPAQLSALATAHTTAVLNANWGKGRPRMKGQGGSLFVDAKGQLVSRLSLEGARLDVTME